jgi:putative heme iron utilization protein
MLRSSSTRAIVFVTRYPQETYGRPKRTTADAFVIEYGHLPASTNPNDGFLVLWRRICRLCPLFVVAAAGTVPADTAGAGVSARESTASGAALARRLMRTCDRAALATSLNGAPYVSLVLITAALDASPLLLLSDLAQHSRNIAFDPRLALLLDGTEGHADRLDGPRLSVLGRAEKVDDPGLLARFTARHRSSLAYAGFADFRLYRVVVERGHLVAGFGRIEWIDAADLLSAGDLQAFAAAEPAAVARINRDCGAALDGLAAQRGRGGSGWRLTGLDPDGADLCCGGAAARIDFPAPATSAEAAIAALVHLVETTTAQRAL